MTPISRRLAITATIVAVVAIAAGVTYLALGHPKAGTILLVAAAAVAALAIWRWVAYRRWRTFLIRHLGER